MGRPRRRRRAREYNARRQASGSSSDAAQEPKMSFAAKKRKSVPRARLPSFAAQGCRTMRLSAFAPVGDNASGRRHDGGKPQARPGGLDRHRGKRLRRLDLGLPAAPGEERRGQKRRRGDYGGFNPATRLLRAGTFTISVRHISLRRNRSTSRRRSDASLFCALYLSRWRGSPPLRERESGRCSP